MRLYGKYVIVYLSAEKVDRYAIILQCFGNLYVKSLRLVYIYIP